jgi:hypothetical protein
MIVSLFGLVQQSQIMKLRWQHFFSLVTFIHYFSFSIQESPKTPKTNVVATEESSPTEPLCSTPLNTRKRNCTPDDNDSPVLMTFTQDLRRFGTDVTWQWNSPKRHIGETKAAKEKPAASRRVATVARPQDSPSPIRPSERLQRTTQLSGFYKFQKELQELELFSKKEELWVSLEYSYSYYSS